MWGLNENDSHRLLYLNVWAPAGGTVWERLEGMALLEEICHWRSYFEVFKSICHFQSALPFCFCGSDVSSQLLFKRHAFLPAVMLLGMMVMDAKPLKL